MFSDFYDDYYYKLLNIWKRGQQNALGSSASSILPFRLFTNEDRKLLKLYKFKHRWDDRQTETVKTISTHKYDGFLIKLSGYSSSYVTIIYLCMDDRIVKKIFDDYNIDVVCIFEKTAGGGEGGALSLRCLYNSSEEAANIKYIFTDHYFYDDVEKKLRFGGDYGFLADDYHISNCMRGNYFAWNDSMFYSKDFVAGYGQGFCLARRKANVYE